MSEDQDQLSTKRKRTEHQKAVEQGLAKKRSSGKPLPAGYTCKICGAVDDHAVYQCPDGKNAASAKASKSTAVPSSSSSSSGKHTIDAQGSAGDDSSTTEHVQVYLSGLPFDTTSGKLVTILREKNCAQDLKHPFGIHVVCFPDSPNKCKGVAFITFTNKAAADLCVKKLDGMEAEKEAGKGAGGEDKEGADARTMTIHAEINKRKQAKEWKPPAAKTAPSVVFKRGVGMGEGEKEIRCYRCGGKHEPKDCTFDRQCYRCRSTDHISSECPLKKGNNSGFPSAPTHTGSATSAPTPAPAAAPAAATARAHSAPEAKSVHPARRKDSGTSASRGGRGGGISRLAKSASGNTGGAARGDREGSGIKGELPTSSSNTKITFD